MYHQKLRTFSNVTPVLPGKVTMVDLGDTSHTLGPFVVSTQPQQQHVEASVEDESGTQRHSAHAPIVDLRNITQFRE